MIIDNQMICELGGSNGSATKTNKKAIIKAMQKRRSGSSFANTGGSKRGGPA